MISNKLSISIILLTILIITSFLSSPVIEGHGGGGGSHSGTGSGHGSGSHNHGGGGGTSYGFVGHSTSYIGGVGNNQGGALDFNPLYYGYYSYGVPYYVELIENDNPSTSIEPVPYTPFIFSYVPKNSYVMY
jgi:hypothetical protein